MSERFFEMDLTDLTEINSLVQQQATQSLEQGSVVYLPKLAFFLRSDEEILLNPAILSSGHKNVSFDIKNQKLSGIDDSQLHAKAEFMMQRFAHFSRSLIEQLFPTYHEGIRWGRTSYRPAEIEGRSTSKRKDDTRLHVDAFPSTPVQGNRILRVFCNINPYNKPRVWHLGDPFPQVLNRFFGRIPSYNPLKSKALHWMKITRSQRAAYDHYMLHLHDAMKLDDEYQQNISKFVFDFPAKSTWIVFTDQVSHAALKGQYLLEQTFYLPVETMVTPAHSPLKQWEKKLVSCKIPAL